MANRLENKYTWEEIGELFADRIEAKEFILKKNWNRKHFLEWFKIREKIGILFDWRLVGKCYTIWKELQNENDHFTVIVGSEGIGKTTLAIAMCSWIAPDMDLNDIVFDMPNYISKLMEIADAYKKLDRDDRSILIDEGGISLFSRESLTKSNKTLAKSFMIQRFLNVHVAICIPHYWSIDTMIRNHRIKTLIICKERGSYKCIVNKGIGIMNKIGKKNKERPLNNIPIPYNCFWEGNWSKDFPKVIDKSEYDKYKLKHIRKFLHGVQDEADTVRMVKIGEASKKLTIDRRTLIKMIKNKEIEGKKIGTNWFLTKKALEKLSMVKNS